MIAVYAHYVLFTWMPERKLLPFVLPQLQLQQNIISLTWCQTLGLSLGIFAQCAQWSSRDLKFRGELL